MQIWTHRGDGPENTLEAFQSAWQKGITHFETDLQLTKDNVIVLAHDDSILRLTGINKKIAELSWDELAKIHNSRTHNWTKLEELLVNFPRATISVDLKTDKVAEEFTKSFNSLPKVSKVVVGSFKSDRIKKFRKVHSSCTTALSPAEVLSLKLGTRKQIFGNFYAMIPSSLFKFPILTIEFVSKLSFLNIPSHIWTINNLSEMQNLKRLGVDGLITDEIDLAMNLPPSNRHYD